MPAKYAHLSGKDAENAILELHGIRSNDNSNSAIPKMKKCPRCEQDNTPEKHRCTSCGYIIDERLLAETVKTQQDTIETIVKRLENVERFGEKIDMLFDELINQKSTVRNQARF